MNYRLLGHSGLKVSELCLGAMTFGEEFFGIKGAGASFDESKRIYEAYREAGGNFIDTANIYTNGTSETFLGDLMQGHRQEIVLATKYTNARPGNDANAAGNHRKNMMQSVEASVKRLKTDYIDLYWLHVWDRMTPVEEVMRAFDDLVRQGKILYAGISDAPAWWVAQANTLAILRGWTPFVALQIEYSLTERTVERELIPAAKALSLGLTAWSPLAGGVLTGKYAAKDGGKADGRYSIEMARAFQPQGDRVDKIVAAVREVADQTGRSPAQVALAWLRYREIPVIPIVGARKLTQFEDNLASLTLSLSPDQVKHLDDASRIEMGFPHDFYQNPMALNLVYGGFRDRILA